MNLFSIGLIVQNNIGEEHKTRYANFVESFSWKFPEVPGSVWTLLGISGGSYLISKGIQSKSEEEDKRIDLEMEELRKKGEEGKAEKKPG